jgi:6-phosphogluconolactonase
MKASLLLWVWVPMFCLLASLLSVGAAPGATTLRVYIGTYTGGKSEGIYVSTFDPEIGRLAAPVLAAPAANPSFLALHPNHRVLYAANEVGNFGGTRSGAVSAYRIEEISGRLALLGQQATGGADPCHLAVEAKGRWVFAANYSGGSIAAMPLDTEGGLSGTAAIVQHQGSSVNASRQGGPHAHFIIPDPSHQFALACDLGLDKVLVYRLGAGARPLAANEPPGVSLAPGAGPRHLAFHPNGRLVYVINELNSTLTSFAYDGARGTLRELQTLSTLPENFVGENSCAEVQVHPSGRFVYGSNRRHDSIAAFSVEESSGKLKFLECQPTQGKTPRHFALDPSGRWLLAENQDSNNIVVFRVDLKDGRLTPTGQKVEVGAPVCLLFVP